MELSLRVILQTFPQIYVRQINKDFVLIKIKYLGKIGKIIKKLKEQNMSLIMTKEGNWEITII